jgi:hypothetical protein
MMKFNAIDETVDLCCRRTPLFPEPDGGTRLGRGRCGVGEDKTYA